MALSVASNCLSSLSLVVEQLSYIPPLFCRCMFSSTASTTRMKRNEDAYPTLGRPTTPIFKLLEGRPKRIFSSVAAFFGGMMIYVGSEE